MGQCKVFPQNNILSMFLMLLNIEDAGLCQTSSQNIIFLFDYVNMLTNYL